MLFLFVCLFFLLFFYAQSGRDRQTDMGGGIETDRQTETETETDRQRQRDRKMGVTERTVFPHAGVL